ncbi:MAG: diguanylate cyclase domain-containing protein [Solirubrobacteraceae bacterium]
MAESEVDLDARQAALRSLLARHLDAVVAALADDGSRIALPESLVLGGFQGLAVPAERQTMLNVVVPGDRMTVVAAWERARRFGVGVASVHALSEPDARLTLSMIDGREFCGVWLAVLTRGGQESEAPGDLLAGALVVPSRPRQASMHKSHTAFITAVDVNVTPMLGWTPEQMIGFRSTQFIHPEDQGRAIDSWMQLVSSQGCQRVRVRHRCADGGWLWVEVEHIHNGADDPDDVDVVAHISDISDEMAAHEAVARREQLFSRLAESLPTGVLQLRQDRTVAFANARVGAFLNARTPTTAADLFVNVVQRDRPKIEQALGAALGSAVDSELEVEVGRGGARASRRCAVTIAAVTDQEGKPAAIVCVNDVTESAQLREELRAQANRDALTGALNRGAAIEAIDLLLSGGDRDQIAVIFVDVDHFKQINDRLGHAAGDQLLTAVAQRLERVSRDGELIARLGGDEFLLVCRGPGLPANAATIAQRVRETLNRRVALAAGTVDLCASIGVAWPQTDTTAETLIAHADAAMYESKRTRTGKPVLFADIATHSAA